MEAIGLNPIQIDRIGTDPIRLNPINIGAQGTSPASDRPYIDPAIKEALVGVWMADQNTNDSPTRNIIKNNISNRGGDFEILNAAYSLNSGYGLYATDFTKWSIFSQSNVIKNKNKFLVNGTLVNHWVSYIVNSDVPSFKVKITFPFEMSINYSYISNGQRINLNLNKGSGIYILPANESNIDGSGFQIINFNSSIDYSGLTIEQISDYQGSFVTDGVDDMIVSQKSVSEMLGDSNDITVISMFTHLDNVYNRVNIIRGNTYIQLISTIGKDFNGKSYIFGYSSVDGTTNSVINNILGDKNDYSIQVSGNNVKYDARYSVEGFLNSSNVPTEVSKVAWYWTFIAKRVLTTDEINQIIAYYNLDKYVEPDAYYDVKKQGLTNDNHAEFGDKLIDYSGKSRDMQLYNFRWGGDSGISNYAADFNSFTPNNDVADFTYTDSKIHITKVHSANMALFLSTTAAIKPMKVKITGITLQNALRFLRVKENGQRSMTIISSDGIWNLSESFASTDGITAGFMPTNFKGDCNIIIEQIPTYEGGLVFNGVDDYGQYVGDLGLKDYTVVADRAYVEVMSNGVPIISSIDSSISRPFIYEYYLEYIKPFTFGNSTNTLKMLDINRGISYQSTYIYNTTAFNKGSSTNTGSGLTFGRYGGNAQYAKLVLHSFLMFPYSLSEFLIERQLKKRKLGTLYPNMIQFNPIITSNTNYQRLFFYINNVMKSAVNGIYYPMTDNLVIALTPFEGDTVTRFVVNGKEYSDYETQDINTILFTIPFSELKYPQKISITIN